MQVIVEIDEAYYKFIKQEVKLLNSNSKPHNILANGTPLPKGHGNLIQREDAETIFRNARIALYKQSRTEQIKDLQTRESMLLNAEQFVHLIKPIIEADKEYEVEVITRGNCMVCGKELTEGLFLCKECEDKANSRK